MIRIGMDIGSTTAKVVALDADGNTLYSQYARHNAQSDAVILDALRRMLARCGDADISVHITGSVGMGLAERLDIPFVQEVVAASEAVSHYHSGVRTMIDIGGEDAKIVIFDSKSAPAELRMNGNCAGGTGAFIDQMAVIMGVPVTDMDALARTASQTYSIASRCGVFCKTDIQNLIAKNVSRPDIAASIFRAVVVQTVSTLAHGTDIHTPVLMCGGPLTFMPALRQAFADYLHIDASRDIILPPHGELLPATGAALMHDDSAAPHLTLSALCDRIELLCSQPKQYSEGLTPIFSSDAEYDAWHERISRGAVPKGTLTEGTHEVYIGVDSGSTTTKMVVISSDGRLLHSYYRPNGGNPIDAVRHAMTELDDLCRTSRAVLDIKGCCSTGYGEDLIRTAFGFDGSIVETMAHYMAAVDIDPQVSFILDIGGQDMKAMFVNRGIIDRIEINEACSSGCGTFIETFARTLGYSVQDFCREACRSLSPCDLGTRCTVFMNSKVKHVLRQGASVADIAAGLAYSVVKNCLYKVLKLTDVSSLGSHIVVQGGTMRNDAVVHALELLTGVQVSRCDIPELMGAYGCALYARDHYSSSRSLADVMGQAEFTSDMLTCRGCDNRCRVSRYRFRNGQSYFSGNRCERTFSNGSVAVKGHNCYAVKKRLLFDRTSLSVPDARLTIGIPRCLNMYENFPFWHTLFTSCGIAVRLSPDSDYSRYEKTAGMVMSDNICFPAKLAHSHIEWLASSGVDRIFMPFVVYEQRGTDHNSYNCPIVTGYSEVIKSVQERNVPIDSPAISFKDDALLLVQCTKYLATLGVPADVVKPAFYRALQSRAEYSASIAAECRRTVASASTSDRYTILLAGRPYHTDTLIQHDIAAMIADLGVNVITDDIVRDDDSSLADVNYLAQWSYPNRILRAAKWCIRRPDDVQFVQLTSFGCGPDAFFIDQVRDLLLANGKTFTLLKLDDINNVGSVRLRVRSLIESLRLQHEHSVVRRTVAAATPPAATRRDMHSRRIIVPFFTPYISPLIPAMMRMEGYDVVTLPLSDAESGEWGLKYANNEVCYPATLIVGDIVKAMKSGNFPPDDTIVAMTQTGGQCRASNYLMLIKKALADAGFPQVPVISLTFGSVDKTQPGFEVNWFRILPVAMRAIFYSDCIAKFYHASLVREREPGQAATLRDHYLDRARRLIEERRSNRILDLLAEAADAFNAICLPIQCPRVGVVGEIFLKFNPFAHKNIADWLASHGIEVVPSALVDFFMESFVNRTVRVRSDIERRKRYEFVLDVAYKMVRAYAAKVNGIASRFRHYTPFGDIFAEASYAERIVSLNAQFGEGWLLPAEIIAYAHHGINHVVSLQPFGCIANHIVARGVEKRLKTLYPDINLLSLDFDSGVSDVNITNRLLLFINDLKQTK